MNKIYRIVWNPALQAWVAVSEFAKAKGKGKAGRTGLSATAAGVIGAVALSMTPVEDARAYVAGGGVNGTDANAIAIGSGATTTSSQYYPIGIIGAGNTNINGKTTSGIAVGVGAASNFDGIAIGDHAAASDKSSTSVGTYAIASRQGATAFGTAAMANGRDSTAFGFATETRLYGDLAIGVAAVAGEPGDGNLQNNPLGFNAAIGAGAVATGGNANAIGHASKANAIYTTAIGSNSTANLMEDVAIGHNSVAGTVGRTAPEDSANLALGAFAQATGGTSTALGYQSKATKLYTLALGSGAQATGLHAHALGHDSKATGTDSFAAGNLSSATADKALAIGADSAASAEGATAIGSNVTIDNLSDYATVVGANSTATNASSGIAIGSNSQISGVNATAVGTSSNASKRNSVAMGYQSSASADNALALGADAKASNIGDVALGANSVTGATEGTSGITIADTEYTFAGINPTSQVSVGKAGSERLITNVAAGHISDSSTDAINGSQLFATNSAIKKLDDGAVKYDVIINPDGSKTINYNSVTLGGDTYNSSSKTGGTRIKNVAAGVDGGDVVNVDQLKGVVDAATTRYYSVNDNGAPGDNYLNDGATGVNAIAAGVGASATGSGSIAMGSAAKAAAGRDAIALGTNATVDVPVWTSGIAIGPNAQTRIAFGVAMGENASITVADGEPAADGGVAIGHNAKSLNSRFAENDSTTSTAVGNGAEADAGSSSFGEWARAHSLMGTAIGSGTTVNGDRSTAVGARASTDAADATALGYGAKANIAGGVALGTGSIAKTVAGTAGYLPEDISEAAALAIKNTTSTLGAVSVGDAATGKFRQITGVAAGTVDSDAVNVAQLTALSNKTIDIDDRAVKYDEIFNPDGSKSVNYNSVTLGGDTYNSTTKNGGTRIKNVARGVDDSDAVNMSQLNETNADVTNITNKVENFAGDQSTTYTKINGRGIRYVRTNDDGLPLLDAYANGQGSTAVGYNARSKGLDSLALGRDALSFNKDDVALGSGSVTEEAVGTSSVTINGLGYHFAGVDPLSTVSVGSRGKERTITNVAAGRITSDSTDAINGSQLYATNSAIGVLDKGSVKYDLNVDGSVNYNSVTMGGDTYNSITKTGGTRITNVAYGIDPSDVVNVQQLTEVISHETKYFNANSAKADSVAKGMDSIAVGPNAQSLGDGSIAMGDEAKSTGKGSTAIGQSAQSVGDNSVAMGNGAIANNANDVALGAGSVTKAAVATTSVTINKDVYAVAGTDPTSTVSVGSEGNERTITNVAAGRITADSTDAVNGSELYATNKAIEKISGDVIEVDKGSVKYETNVDGSVNYNKVIMGGDTYDNSTHTGGTTITNVANGVDPSDAVNKYQLDQVDQHVTNISNGTDGMFQVNNTSDLPKPTPTGKDSTAGGAGAIASGDYSTSIGANSKSTHNNSVALGYNSVTDRDNSVSMGSAGHERQVTNVAAGTADTDAANVGQLKQGVNNSYQYTNKKFNDLKNMVDDQKDKLSAGIAGAMATAGLPQPYQPGASMVGLAGGTYQGESAIALGVSTISDNGKWVTKIAGTTNSQGDVGAAVGVGYQF